MRLTISGASTEASTAIRGFGVGDGMRVDPRAVAAVGQRLGSSVDALRRAHTDSATARFGPDALGSDLRAHGIAYATGMADVGAVIAAMADSVVHLAGRFDSAATTLASLDSDVADDITTSGEAP